MNGASKCVQSDWRSTNVDASSFHVSTSGALHFVPSFQVGSAERVGAEGDGDGDGDGEGEAEAGAEGEAEAGADGDGEPEADVGDDSPDEQAAINAAEAKAVDERTPSR
jgi:hypothetical protein